MYLARYGDGPSTILQAVFRLESSLADTPDENDTWRQQRDQVIDQLLASAGVHIAFRVQMADRRLERVLAASAAEKDQDQLQRLARRFAALNEIVRDSVQCCEHRDQHDSIVTRFPAVRAGVNNHPYPFAGCQLAQNFRLAPLLGRLLAEAYPRCWRLALQANYCRYQPDPEDLRLVRKNLVRVEEARLPAKLLELQQQLVEGMARARFLVDEYVGFDAAEPRRHLGHMIEEHFQTTLGQLGFDSPPLVWDEADKFDDLLFTGFHSSWAVPADAMTRAGTAVDEQALRTLLCWRPPRPKSTTPPAPKVPAQPAGRYDIFISYSSKDSPVAEKVCAVLEKGGDLRCWMAPRDIVPGQTWAGAIEDATNKCRLMVLVFSQHANESPQVPREVELAVHKRLRIIPFKIDSTMPTQDMAYFLRLVHWINAFSGPLEGHLETLARTVSQWLPQVK